MNDILTGLKIKVVEFDIREDEVYAKYILNPNVLLERLGLNRQDLTITDIVFRSDSYGQRYAMWINYKEGDKVWDEYHKPSANDYNKLISIIRDEMTRVDSIQIPSTTQKNTLDISPNVRTINIDYWLDCTLGSYGDSEKPAMILVDWCEYKQGILKTQFAIYDKDKIILLDIGDNRFKIGVVDRKVVPYVIITLTETPEGIVVVDYVDVPNQSFTPSMAEAQALAKSRDALLKFTLTVPTRYQ